jgi:hypothetical protein
MFRSHTRERWTSESSNAAESNVLSKVACDHLTDVKQVPSKNFAWRLEVSSVQNSRNPRTERTGWSFSCEFLLTVLGHCELWWRGFDHSDEAHFHLSSYVNKQNFKYWHKKPLHDEKVTIWCGVSTFGVIGPYFFEENQAITMYSERYCTMLQTFLATELWKMRQRVRNVC